jgi:hypothetical protein
MTTAIPLQSNSQRTVAGCLAFIPTAKRRKLTLRLLPAAVCDFGDL